MRCTSVTAALQLNLDNSFQSNPALISSDRTPSSRRTARRSDYLSIDLHKLHVESPAEYRKQEYARMQNVLRGLTRVKWVEAAFIVLGIAVFLFTPQAAFSKGLGGGLFIQGCVQLFFDFFADKRAKEYLKFITHQP